MNTRLLVALTVAFSTYVVMELFFPFLSFIMPYFSFILLFAVWSPSIKAILTLSALTSLAWYFLFFKNYVLAEAIVNFAVTLGNVTPQRIWIFLIYWIPCLAFFEIYSAYFTVKQLKLMERIGF